LSQPAPAPALIVAARPWGVPPAVLLAIAAAWAAAIAAEASGAAALVHHDAVLSGGAPSAVALVGFLAGWQLMIAAMMLPSSLPLVRMFWTASSSAPERSRALVAFVGAYALVWSGFGLAALLGDMALHAGVDSWAWLEERSWVIAPAALLLAGAFQFSSLKEACLRSCRHPASFMTRHYRRGVGGAFSLGARHGVYCVGCCWALMLVLFAAGVASLVWMAALTALMVHEKTRPAGARAVPVTGAALLALGSTLLLLGAATS
jgi:predicted metal-binding membrane protein